MQGRNNALRDYSLGDRCSAGAGEECLLAKIIMYFDEDNLLPEMHAHAAGMYSHSQAYGNTDKDHTGASTDVIASAAFLGAGPAHLPGAFRPPRRHCNP